MLARFVTLLLLVLSAAVTVIASHATPARAPVLTEHALRSFVADTPATPGDVPEDIAGLRERIADVLAREAVPGVGIALVDRSGVLWSGGVGVADLQTGAPVHADTVFRVASISKSIVGLGALRLHAEGRLDLDAPIADLLPDLEIDNPWHADAPITIAHALEHTTGFDDMRFNEWFADVDEMAPHDALAINPRSRVVRWRPGSRMSYSNVGYSVAALAIERAAGEPFEAWLTAEVLRPLGMHGAAFHRTGDLAARLATGYRSPEHPVPYRSIAHRGAGALLASPADLGGLVHFWLQRGEGFAPIVPAHLLERIERASTWALAPAGEQYGLGNYGDVSHPVAARGHDGGLPGYFSCYRYFPSLGVGYVMLLNSSHSVRAFVEIRQLLFAWLVRGRVLPDPPASPEGVQPPSGFFALANPRHELFGFLERSLLGFSAQAAPDGGLRLVPLLGVPIDLVATPTGGWRHRAQSGESVRFGMDAEGRSAMAAGFVHAEAASHGAALVRLWLLLGTSWSLDFAPIYALAFLITMRLRGRGIRGAGLVVWPALASLALSAATFSFMRALMHDELGDVSTSTVGVCVATLAFAFFSARAFVASLAAAVAPDSASWLVRLVPSVTALLAFGLTLWLGAHGIIGLRTWAW
jgi:CubicO group peptidase (beta-lactamase class C family)